MRRLGWAALALGTLASLSCARGDVLSDHVNERRGDVVVTGETLHDPTATRPSKKPGILLLDDAADPTAARQRAASWARSGRVVLRLDPPRTAPETGADRSRSLRTQAEAALAILRRDARVESRDLAIVGYNAGATVALSLATAGLALDGVVCVGGDPEPPSVEASRRIKCLVLLVSRPEDPEGRRRALEDALRRGEVDWRATRAGPGQTDAAVDAFLNRLWTATATARQDTNTPPPSNANTGTSTGTIPRPAPSPSPMPTVPRAEPKPSRPGIRLPTGVPSKVADILAHVDATGEAKEGYVGGRTFINAERLLPQNDRQGRRIRYREWDVNPLRPGVNRGAERLVTGNDGSAYYTSDHYESFNRIR